MAIVVDALLKLSGPVGGFTFYQKNGKTIVRPAHNANSKSKRKRMTREQFIQRQRLLRNNTLWQVMRQTGEVFFEGGFSPCHRFRSINQGVADVFMTKHQQMNHMALLLPGMVLSDGPIQPISYQLGEVNGQPALLTDLTETEAQKGRLLLYVLRQEVYRDGHRGLLLAERATVSAKMVEVNPVTETQAIEGLAVAFVDGVMVLTGEMFADKMVGFGLVRVIDGHTSTQQLVTRCTYYESFTTKEALETAFISYKGTK